MKDHTQLNVIVHSSLALAIALVIWAPAQAQSTMLAKEKPMMESKTAVQMPATEPAKEPMMAVSTVVVAINARLLRTRN